jgi:hypothetical protein
VTRKITQAEAIRRIDFYTNSSFQPEPGWRYENSKEVIRGLCLRPGCGKADCQTTLNRLQQGHNHCRRCVGTETYTTNEAKAIIAEMTGGMFAPAPEWRFTNIKTPIPGCCLVPGCGWDRCSPTFDNLRRQGHCLRCAGREPIDQQKALLRLAEYSDGLFLPNPDWRYVDVMTAIPGRCLAPGCEKTDCAPTLNGLSQGRGHCSRCAGNEQLTHEHALERLAELTEDLFEPAPTWRYVSATTPIPGRCLVPGCTNTNCRPTLANLSQRQGFCTDCAEYGMIRSEPGFLYLLMHDAQQLVKLGVCNTASRRLEGFGRLGWTLCDKHDFERAGTAEDLEKCAHRVLAGRLAESALDGPDLDKRRSKAAGRLRGQSEMYPIELLDPAERVSLKSLVEWCGINLHQLDSNSVPPDRVIDL